MMKLLVYGSRGWIGTMFLKELNDKNIDYIVGEKRAENIDELENEIINSKATNIISFIGRTHGDIGEKKYTTIDYLEQDGKLKENVRDNLYSPLTIALIAKKHDVHYAYLGTGCIFEFDEKHPFGKEENGFTEESTPNFFGSGYSTVKGYTDRLMHLFDNVLNMRIRMPITGEMNPRNFITKIVTYEKICSIPNSMTVLPTMFPIMIDMLKNKITGTINLTNPGLISHNDILEMYKEIVDPSFKWKNFTVEEQNAILASGRSNNYLDTSRLEELYPDILNIKDGIKQCIILIKNAPIN
jgi:dTDP-4-dehydrorhamnose reductase